LRVVEWRRAITLLFLLGIKRPRVIGLVTVEKERIALEEIVETLLHARATGRGRD